MWRLQERKGIEQSPSLCLSVESSVKCSSSPETFVSLSIFFKFLKAKCWVHCHVGIEARMMAGHGFPCLKAIRFVNCSSLNCWWGFRIGNNLGVINSEGLESQYAV